MHEDLEAYRRLLSITYRRYIEADILLAEALNDMQAYFPAERMPYRGTIGAPGSRVRRLRERRDQALLRLQSSYAKLKIAKGRVEHRRSGQGRVFSLCFHSE